MSGPSLSFSGVSVAFGGVRALSDVACKVTGGEVVGILGPNGAGKTTLLNVLSRLIPVKGGGTIKFGEHDIMRARPHDLSRIGIARTFQGVELSTTDTLVNNILCGALPGIRGWASRRVRARLRAEALEFMRIYGIERWHDVPVRQTPYAVGKRAQICRALMSNPSLILLDEPVSGMTASEKQEVQQALLQTHHDRGVALLVIEHDVKFLTGMADHLMALNFGRVIADGYVDDVISDQNVIEAYLGVDEDDA